VAVMLCLNLALMMQSSSGATQSAGIAPINGLHDSPPRVHALVGARIVVAPGRIIEKGTIVLRDGLVSDVGPGLDAPADARIWDMTGRTIYPGLIEISSHMFLPDPWKGGSPSQIGDASDSKTGSLVGERAWNAGVVPQRSAYRMLTPDPAGAGKLRALGFTLANVTPARGIFRGSAVLVATGGASFNASIVRATTTQEVAFDLGSNGPGRSYPSSLMGCIALIRQTFCDAQWYASARAAYGRLKGEGVERPEVNEALEALLPVVRREQTVLFELTDELDAARAAKLAAEFNLRFALRGVGTEYRNRIWLSKSRVPTVIPLDFPDPPEVEAPGGGGDLGLHALEHWELAPSNAAMLAQAGVPLIITSAGLRKPESNFWPHLRVAVARGLAPEQALAALTTMPAELLGVGSSHGTLDRGRTASLIVSNGDLFKSDDSFIELVWVDGELYELDSWQRMDAGGTWKLSWTDVQGPDELSVETLPRSPKFRARMDGQEVAISLNGKRELLIQLSAEMFSAGSGLVRLAASERNGELTGRGEMPDGSSFRWSARRMAVPQNPKSRAENPKGTEALISNPNLYPAGAYGREGTPMAPDAILFRNATIWTCAPPGVMERADILVRKGRIDQVGVGLTAPPGALLVDASGRHISPGIIDCHSHTAISRGMNEVGSAVTVEARIGDVLDPTDIAIYRELAGGTTVANILHGSSNPIGGQNQVIKLRWGGRAEDLKFDGAKPGVKFALGENVTQTQHAGSRSRYPLSRMGVPELMRDTFNRARDYERAWLRHRSGLTPWEPRRDLRLEGVLEILRGDRMIHIHSYRQDEVLAFVRLAEEFKLPVAAFHHALEGYKVATEIARLGAGVSTFSDWWAYKAEAFDAIPQNGAMLHNAGITVSFNSDSNELARRLNTEAAKAMKYGGLSAVDALNLVTINPALQLGIADRVGSLEAGKDADIVVWNHPPLSTLARVEQTWIDGRLYFDRVEDGRQRANASKRRSALLQKILAAKRKPPARTGDDSEARVESPESLQRAMEMVHEHDGYRGIYHDGDDLHNCSTHTWGSR